MSTLVAPCAIGAEKVLSNELKQLDFIPQGTLPGRVIFTPSTEEMAQGDKGDLSAMYRANLCLRTADRIYLRMASFSCTDFDTLFDGVRSIPWYDYFRKNTRVVVDKVRTHSSRLSSEHSVQSIVHKAIYESLGQAWHMTVLPETGEEANVRVYIDSDVVSILLDLSGMPLHRRGYRTAGGEAPIRETLAAVLLQLMNWRRKVPLHDAFCGSGTIPIEATLYAHNIAPGLGRSFALEKLTIFDSADGKKIIESERQKAALATRVFSQNREVAILEYLTLSSYFYWGSYDIANQNSSTNVTKSIHYEDESISPAKVFTAANHPHFVNHLVGLPSPTENFVRNYGPRLHHIALSVMDGEIKGQANIDYVVDAIKSKGKDFLLDVIGSREEGLKQIFSSASEHSSLIIEYVQRFGDFDGFFTKQNVADLTHAAGVEENLQLLQAESDS